MLVYSPNTELPEEYSYAIDENEMSLEKYISEFDFGSMQNIRIGEREINIVMNTYIEMSLEKSDEYSGY